MPGRKLLFRNWIVETGHNPARCRVSPITGQLIYSNQKITRAVRKALKQLPYEEQEFIERFYFAGQSYREISSEIDCRLTRMEGLHRQAVARLKKLLAPFVKREFGIILKSRTRTVCPVCISPYRDQIDTVIDQKKPEETWKKTICILKERYNIPIKSPQTLIGHMKYHIKQGGTNGRQKPKEDPR